MHRALRDEPLNEWVIAMASHVMGFIGDDEESLVHAERAHQLDPDSFFAHWNLMRAKAYSGLHDDAIGMAPRILMVSGRNQWALGMLAWSYRESGRTAEARAVHDELEGRSRHEFVSPFWLSVTADAAGLDDDTARFVRRARDERDPLVVWGRTAPLWRSIRQRPVFRSCCRSGIGPELLFLFEDRVDREPGGQKRARHCGSRRPPGRARSCSCRPS
mgnify:CR=1 FL=1